MALLLETYRPCTNITAVMAWIGGGQIFAVSIGARPRGNLKLSFRSHRIKCTVRHKNNTSNTRFLL